MTTQRRRHGWLAALLFALLVALVGLVASLLSGPTARQQPGNPASPSTNREDSADAAPPAASPPVVVEPERPSRVPTAAAVRPPAPPNPVSSAEPTAQPPRRTHAIAPAAVPTEIRAEPDPERRTRLLARHRLKVARARLAILRRRERLLSETLERERARQAPPDRLRRIQKQLDDIARSADRARDELERARHPEKK